MGRLAEAFVDSAFGRTSDGRYVFIPFGALGGRYLIQDRDQLLRLRRQLGLFVPLAAIPLLSMLSLFVLPGSLGDTLTLPILAVTGVSFALFAGLFAGWVWFVKQRLTQLDEGVPSTLGHLDAQELAARELRRYLICGDDSQRCAREALVAVGALAGFACQVMVRIRASVAQQPAGLIEVALKDGRLLYFGDDLNAPLAEMTPSVWSIISEGAPADELHGLFSEMAAQLAAEDGEVRFREPMRLLTRHWNATKSILEANRVTPEHWPLTIARAGRELVHHCGALPPKDAAYVIMRAAIPMAKVDPAQVMVPEDATADERIRAMRRRMRE